MADIHETPTPLSNKKVTYHDVDKLLTPYPKLLKTFAEICFYSKKKRDSIAEDFNEKVVALETMDGKYSKEEIYSIALKKIKTMHIKEKIVIKETIDPDCKKISTGKGKGFVQGKDGIYEYTEKDEILSLGNLIIKGNYCDIKRKLYIDGETYFEYSTPDKTHRGDINRMKDDIKKEGCILSQRSFSDALNAMCSDIPVVIGHATYGVYNEKDGMELCLDVIPVKDLQETWYIRCNGIKTKFTKEDLIPYFEATKHWHPYEVLPAMGMSVMAPFALHLREKGKLIPILWHYSHKSHLGKTTVGHIYSKYLFKIDSIGGNSINSGYRFLTIVDVICGMITINEADKVKWNGELDDYLKQAPESYIAGTRGRQNLTTEVFLSRVCPVITSNRFSIKSKNTMMRILKIEYDSKKAIERKKEENTDRIAELLNSMEPIGWGITQTIVDYHKKDFEELVSSIEKTGNELRKHTTFIDPRRPFAWGVIYEGLKCWGRLAEEYDIDWETPTIEEFAEKVVAPIEKTTSETGTAPVAHFANWWNMWKVRNTRTKHDRIDGDSISTDTVLGTGKIWCEKEITIGDNVYKGDVITTAVLQEYQKEREHSIDDLKELGKSVSDIIGVPTDEVYKVWNLGDKKALGVFIPHNISQFGVVKSEWKKHCGESEPPEKSTDEILEELF